MDDLILDTARDFVDLGERAAKTLLDARPATEAAVQVYRSIDAAIADAVTQQKLPIACKSGCDYCCYYRILATPLEIFTVVEYVKKFWSTDGQKLRLSAARD